MKIGAVQGMMVLVVCGVSMAHSNYAQLLDKQVTISLNGVSFEKALKELETIAGVKFVYSADQLRAEGEVTLEGNTISLRDVLHDLFAPRGIQYKVHEKEASITLKKQAEAKEKDQSMLDEDKNGNRYGPVMQITGTVTDATTQQPMAGVNIVVKGTTNGTTTDAEGKYGVNADDGNILVFSFIGYTSVEMKVGGQSVMDVALLVDVKSLDEVVVNAGYYTTTKETQTGNIVKVEAKDIAMQPVSNPIAALQGRIPGVEVTQNTGVPGGNFQVRVRGTNSLSNGNDPLYIVDGVPFTATSMSFRETSGNILGNPNPQASQGSSPLNSINPSDIESIEVLKDADATAIYGSRGSNGVILITTKKGMIGKTKIDLNFYSGTASVSHKMNLLGTQQYTTMRKEAFANDKVTPTSGNAPDLMVWDTTRQTDWQKELIGGSAQITDTQLSISGGEKNTQFVVGGGYHRETTVFPGSNADQRISIHTNIINTSGNQKLRTSVSVNYARNNANLPGQDLTTNALTLPPDGPVIYDQSGNLSWKNWTSAVENPLAFLKRKYEGSISNLIGNAVLRYNILPNLEVKANLGYISNVGEATNAIPISSLSPSATTKINRTYFSKSNFQNWIVEPQISWKPKIGGRPLDLLAGATFLDQTNEGNVLNASGFSSEALMKSIGAAPTILPGTNYYSQYRYQALFGRINYNLKDRYIFNVTARRDGSSRFGPGKQFALFGAVGGAWIFSREEFIRNAIPFLSFGKFRASYGTTGSDQIGDYQFLDTYSTSGMYQGKKGLIPARLNNPNFAWETNKKLEGGIDLGFMDDRIWLGVSYYRNRSSNQLVGLPLAATTGFTSVQGNFPATVQNRGIEIVLDTRNIESNDFKWTMSINMTFPRNKLLQFPDIALFPDYANAYEVGQPTTILKRYNYEGVDPATGVYYVSDVNGDKSFTTADKQTIRFIGRNFYSGMQNSFQYKGFQLDVLFQYVNQQGLDYTSAFVQAPGTQSNQPVFVMSRWQSAEDISDTQKFATRGAPIGAYSFFLNSNQVVTDISFVRVKNLSFSYSLPPTCLRKLNLSVVRIFIQGQNLITFTGYKGLDPESGSTKLPPLRTLTGGLHLSF